MKNLQEWVVNGDTSEEAISQFGYENCFKTLALDQEKWDNYMYFYQGDKSALNRSDYSCVRSLFYHEHSTEHIHVGEIICNKGIAADLLAIFRQLYEAKYHIESLSPVPSVDLIDLTEKASASYNFTFSFHVFSNPVDEQLLKGLAVIVNPYAPPVANDLAVKLFKQHGFTWGGDEAGGQRYRFEKK